MGGGSAPGQAWGLQQRPDDRRAGGLTTRSFVTWLGGMSSGQVVASSMSPPSRRCAARHRRDHGRHRRRDGPVRRELPAFAVCRTWVRQASAGTRSFLATVVRLCTAVLPTLVGGGSAGETNLSREHHLLKIDLPSGLIAVPSGLRPSRSCDALRFGRHGSPRRFRWRRGTTVGAAYSIMITMRPGRLG